MLSRIDRILITSPDAAATADRFVALLDGRIDRHDRVARLDARRTVVRVGDSEVEILEPDGAGMVADHLATGRGGPFAAGVASKDVHGLRRRLAEHGIVPTPIGDEEFFVDGRRLGIPGLNVVVSKDVERPPVGLVDGLYEVTHLTDAADAAATRFAAVFALDAGAFVPIESAHFGYRGHLTLFARDRLHRIETISPYAAEKTMGRYFGRFGPSLYMCYAETGRLPELRARLESLAPKDWTGSREDPNGLFVHPRALGGVMMGVSRRTFAWTWSGYPARVEPT